jgi:hypothetical protein
MFNIKQKIRIRESDVIPINVSDEPPCNYLHHCTLKIPTSWAGMNGRERLFCEFEIVTKTNELLEDRTHLYGLAN